MTRLANLAGDGTSVLPLAAALGNPRDARPILRVNCVRQIDFYMNGSCSTVLSAPANYMSNHVLNLLLDRAFGTGFFRDCGAAGLPVSGLAGDELGVLPLDAAPDRPNHQAFDGRNR